MLKSFLVALIALVALTSAAARAEIDVAGLSVNGVSAGDTVDQVKKALGEPAHVKGSRGQFLLYDQGAWGRLTVELDEDGKHVQFVANGSSLSQSGKVVLQLGDPAASIEEVLAGTDFEKNEKVDSWEYVVVQPKAMLIVVVKDGKVAGLMQGRSGWGR